MKVVIFVGTDLHLLIGSRFWLFTRLSIQDKRKITKFEYILILSLPFSGDKMG